MRLGLILNSQFLPEEDPVLRTRELLEQVRLCRDAGFSGVYVIQHFLSQPFQAPQLWPLLGRISAEAGEMRVGSSIFLLTLFNPVYAAEHAVSMDILTGGNFVFGIGLGFRDEELEAFGIPAKTRARRYTEATSLLLRLLDGEEVTHDGEFFKLTGAKVLPRPVQLPRPPVWMAASGDLGVRRAARFGLPWLINPHATIETVRGQLGVYREELARSGNAMPAERPIFRELAIGHSRQAAVTIARPHLERKYGAYAAWGLDKPMPEHERLDGPFEELAQDRFVVGDPQECVAELRRYEEVLGATDVLARVQWPGMAHRDVMAQLELLGDQVIPEISG